MEVGNLEGWSQWHEGTDGILVLTFRPDVFDGEQFPEPCLPTITVKRARDRGPKGRPRQRPGSSWSVTFHLEPAVELRRALTDDRSEAIDRAQEWAKSFSADQLDYRDAYLEPRPEYLEALDTVIQSEQSSGL